MKNFGSPIFAIIVMFSGLLVRTTVFAGGVVTENKDQSCPNAEPSITFDQCPLSQADVAFTDVVSASEEPIVAPIISKLKSLYDSDINLATQETSFEEIKYSLTYFVYGTDSKPEIAFSAGKGDYSGFSVPYVVWDNFKIHPLKSEFLSATSPNNWSFPNELFKVLAELPEGHLEMINHPRMRDSMRIVPKYAWDQVMGMKSNNNHYQENVYSLIEKEIANIETKLKKRISHIVDLGGGNGDMLARLIASRTTSPTKYTLIDQSKGLLEAARAKLPKEVDIIEGDVFGADLSKYPPDTVFISSGFLSVQVLYEEESEKISNLLSQLPPNAWIVVTGLTPLFVDRDMLQSAGFRVDKMVWKENILNPEKMPKQFYVAQKKRK